MSTTYKAGSILTILGLCTLLMVGCSGDQGKKEEKKTVTVQEQLGKDAAQALQKPMEEARKTVIQVEAKTEQATKEMADGAKKTAQEAELPTTGQTGGKEKKKLEGC
jgi:hypothetical protein